MRALRSGDCFFAFSTSLIPYPLSLSSLVIKRSGLLSGYICRASSSIVIPPSQRLQDWLGKAHSGEREPIFRTNHDSLVHQHPLIGIKCLL